MADTQRSIFRSSALERHMYGQEKDVLPRIICPPVFLFLWLLLSLCVVAGCFAWSGRVPVDVAGGGVVVNTAATQTGQKLSGESVAVIFVPTQSSQDSAPTDVLTKIRVNQTVHLVVGSSGVQITRKVDMVEPTIISPDAARKQYGLSGDLSLLITEPSVVVKVKLGPDFVATAYAGSSVRAAVDIRARRVISFVPGLDSLIGEN